MIFMEKTKLSKNAILFAGTLLKRLGILEKFPFLSDISLSERIVEYAWILKNLDLERGKVLDVGCSGTLFPIMLANLGYDVVGIDIKNYRFQHPNFNFIRCDLLNPPTELLLNQKFDIITSVSSIEHVGFWGKSIDYDGDMKAISVLKKLLKNNGILFLTFGYGNKFQFHYHPLNPKIPFGRLYDENRIETLSSGFEVIKKEIFIKSRENWVPSEPNEVRKITYPRSWLETKSIVCIKLKIKND